MIYSLPVGFSNKNSMLMYVDTRVGDENRIYVETKHRDTEISCLRTTLFKPRLKVSL